MMCGDHCILVDLLLSFRRKTPLLSNSLIEKCHNESLLYSLSLDRDVFLLKVLATRTSSFVAHCYMYYTSSAKGLRHK
jgi:hypothetical protein